MSKYTDAVEHGLRNLEAVFTGTCPGCDECREIWDYVPDENDEGFFIVRAAPNAGRWLTEASCEEACRKEFHEARADGRVYDEGSFSWSGCDICGSALGGDKEVWHYIDDAGGIQHEHNACVDCVMYLVNGEEPEEWSQ